MSSKLNCKTSLVASYSQFWTYQLLNRYSTLSVILSHIFHSLRNTNYRHLGSRNFRGKNLCKIGSYLHDYSSYLLSTSSHIKEDTWEICHFVFYVDRCTRFIRIDSKNEENLTDAELLKVEEKREWYCRKREGRDAIEFAYESCESLIVYLVYI